MDGTEASVETVAWPDEVDRLDELRELGVPRMVLVAPSAPPPLFDDELEDWVRVPVDADELSARARRLARLAGEEPSVA